MLIFCLKSGSLNFKQTIDDNLQLIDMLDNHESNCEGELVGDLSVIAAYSLIVWAFEGKKQGNGYGFPFDRPHLEFVKRLKDIHVNLDQLIKIDLNGNCKNNKSLHKVFSDLSNIIEDKSLWNSVDAIELEISIFEKLRNSMRIAPKKSENGLNSESADVNIKTIENRVKIFRENIINTKGYSENILHQKMIRQLDKYWVKLFADPIEVKTSNGKIIIQPQRTNNYAEQNFRDLKRGYRKKTGNGSLGKTLRTMLANTPLVKNLQNPEYMKILLDGKSCLEELFAEIDSNEVLNELKISQINKKKYQLN